MMKTLSFLMAVSCLFPLLGCRAAEKVEGRVISLEYRVQGMASCPQTYIKMDVSDNVLRLAYSQYSNEIQVFRAPENLPEKIDEIVKRYRLHRLKERYQPVFEILDGYSWHLNIRYENGHIYSGGNNAWPSKKQREGLDQLVSLLEETVKSLSEDDLIGKEYHYPQAETDNPFF